jgi:hypothetical protein
MAMRVMRIRSVLLVGFVGVAAAVPGCRSDLVAEDGVAGDQPGAGTGATAGATGEGGQAGAPSAAGGESGAAAGGTAGTSAAGSGGSVVAAGGAAGTPAGTAGAGGAAAGNTAGAAGTTTTPVMNPPPPPPPPADPTRFNFEADTQGWHDLRSTSVTPVRSAVQHFGGVAALEIPIVTTAAGANEANYRYIGVTNDQFPAAVGPGAKITFRVWFPGGIALTGVQPFVLDKRNGTFMWEGAYQPLAALKPNMWNTIELTLSDKIQMPIELGVQWLLSGPWTGSVYVDSVTW